MAEAATSIHLVDQNTNYCGKCNIELIPGKNWSGWHRKRNDYICSPCGKKRHKHWRDHRLEENRERERKRYRENRTEILARQKKFQENNAERFAYRRNRDGAKQRGIPFDLSFDQFMLFWQKDCEYCGVNIKTIGLDRVDNDTGYTMENIIPCCGVCNRMKSNRSALAFIKQCENIARRSNKWRRLLRQPRIL
jgi:hypothetical protein